MNEAARTLCIVGDPSDDLVASAPVGWASEQLRRALNARGIPTELVERVRDAPPDTLCVAVAGRTAPLTRELLGAVAATVPDAAEALGLTSGRLGSRHVVLATGSDVRGLVYAVLELFLGVTGTEEGVAHFAHLGGLVGGFIMLRYWRSTPAGWRQ